MNCNAYQYFTAQVMKGSQNMELTFKQYQKDCQSTAIYPDNGRGNAIYPLLELVGETAEVAEKLLTFIPQEYQSDMMCTVLRMIWRLGTMCEHLKKAMRDNRMVLSQDRSQAIINNIFPLSRHCSVLLKDYLLDNNGTGIVLSPIWHGIDYWIDGGAIGKELGDILYAIAQLASEMKLELGLIARNNTIELADRMERGVIMGEGDNR
jgi:NTP pyrophosphatase (non-canonical NTP hydrolase)